MESQKDFAEKIENTRESILRNAREIKKRLEFCNTCIFAQESSSIQISRLKYCPPDQGIFTGKNTQGKLETSDDSRSTSRGGKDSWHPLDHRPSTPKINLFRLFNNPPCSNPGLALAIPLPLCPQAGLSGRILLKNSVLSHKDCRGPPGQTRATLHQKKKTGRRWPPATTPGIAW